MLHRAITMKNLQCWLRAGFSLILIGALCLGLVTADPLTAMARDSRLPAGNAITDGNAILRNALPIENPSIREFQANLEGLSEQLRSPKRWGPISQGVNKASRLANERSADFLANIPAEKKNNAEASLKEIQADLVVMQQAVEAKDKTLIREKRQAILDRISGLEEEMVQRFPFEVPAEYSNLPQLKGRATIAMSTSKGDLTIVVDGYSAPVTAGNFVDLVKRGFYNGLPFTRAEESYVLQFGDPDGADEGFVDPKTKQYRSIPLEILVEGDDKPTYGITLEDAGRYQDHPVLPFSSYGALALARGDDPNSGSSQAFFLLFEGELTPAGANLLDGRYSVFGYVTEGQDVLGQLRAGDKILFAKVTQGAGNLV
jgi:peptidylprolyl isomerase